MKFSRNLWSKIGKLINIYLCKNKISIVFLYIFIGINCMFAGWYYNDVIVGVLFVVVGIICLFDDRKEMNEELSVKLCYSVHFISFLLLLFIYSMWWILVYPIELLMIMILRKIVLMKNRGTGSNYRR